MRDSEWAAHRDRVNALANALASSTGPVRLKKPTSNLFRPRQSSGNTGLDAGTLNHVIRIDEENLVADVEGMTTYDHLVDATLAVGLAPTIVPELKSITVGGATTGIGIESSAFRYGLVHHTVSEIDVLVANGRVLTCSRSQNPALFHGFPNSYGSFGYATRVRIELIPVKPFVRLEHSRFQDAEALFSAIHNECRQPSCDYLDGVAFGPEDFVLSRAYFIDTLPPGRTTSDYTWMRQYWKSLREHGEDYLTTHDYLWRWDTDWFWCSKNVGAHLPPVRLLLGRKRLSSVTYQKIMRASHGWPLKLLQHLRPRTESVIQDVDIPMADAGAFLAEFEARIGIRPVWICPFIVPGGDFSLFRLRRDTPYVNFGFWDLVRTRKSDGHYNALVEEMVARFGGKKSLYSRSTYDQATFWSIFDRSVYEELKQEHDPTGRFPGLFEKAVQRD